MPTAGEMSTLFASGDIGGARALLPVITVFHRQGRAVNVLDNGVISHMVSRDALLSIPFESGHNAVKKRLLDENIQSLVFASSIRDTAALTCARAAQSLGVKTVHVLDNWTNYRLRMENDTLPMFIPDVYAVMDQQAFDGARDDGILETILQITGQPALSDLADRYQRMKPEIRDAEKQKHGFTGDRKVIVFVSEPVTADQGDDPDCPTYRGYTEQQVLRLFCDAARSHAEQIEIGILPHPREDRQAVTSRWEKYKGNLGGRVLNMDNGRDAVLWADGVAGMASILLYEAWLMGKPVISIQPDLRINTLEMLKKRENVVFVDRRETAYARLHEWIKMVVDARIESPRHELFLHQQASDRIFEIIDVNLGGLYADFNF